MKGPELEHHDEGLVIHPETQVQSTETGDNGNEPPWKDKEIRTGDYGSNPWRG